MPSVGQGQCVVGQLLDDPVNFLIAGCITGEHSGGEPVADELFRPGDSLLALTDKCRGILGDDGLPDGNFCGVNPDFLVSPPKLLDHAMRGNTIKLWINRA
jgi:hypothetical protein